MIAGFADQGTKDIFNLVDSKEARKALPSNLHKIAKRKLDQIYYSKIVSDLKWPPGNKLERLKGDLSEFYSIRINDQWRVIFQWIDGQAIRVQIVDYH